MGGDASHDELVRPYIGTSFLVPVLLMVLVEGIIERLVRGEIARRRSALRAGPGGDPCAHRLSLDPADPDD